MAASKQLSQVPLPDDTINMPPTVNPLQPVNPVAPTSMPNYVMLSIVTATKLNVNSDANSD